MRSGGGDDGWIVEGYEKSFLGGWLLGDMWSSEAVDFRVVSFYDLRDTVGYGLEIRFGLTI